MPKNGGSMLVPEFGTKLQNLFDLPANPDIRMQTALAKALGVVKDAVNNWITGASGSGPNRVPSNHITPICDLFLISREQLMEKDLKTFQEELRNSGMGWQRLLKMAEDSPSLHLLRSPSARRLTE